MIKYIINADDCGNNPTINTAIDEALNKGDITSTTIMANSRYLDIVHRMVESYPNASFGIHLNLTEGNCFTNSKVFKERGIIDNNGCFVHGNSKRCLYPDKVLSQAIKEEWDAQFDYLINQEHFVISHVDGHHHCHSWPGLETILSELLDKYKISRVRNRYKYPTGRQVIYDAICTLLMGAGIKTRDTSKIGGIQKSYNLRRAFLEEMHRHEIFTTDYFGSYSEFAKQRHYVDRMNCTIELMCHPGIPEYEEEMKMIQSDFLKIKENKQSILISYNEL